MNFDSSALRSLAVAAVLLLGMAHGARAGDVLPGADVASASSLDALIRLGNASLFAGDYDAADEVWREMRKRHPQHPAADVLTVDTLFWRQIHDRDDTRYDSDIERVATRAVALGEAGLEQAPDDAALHLYTGKALMQLGRLKGIRGSYYSAGTHGERGRVHLERALELAPQLVDARYQIGLYYYYATFIPDAVRWLDFLWFVPSGNGDEGLAYLELVAREGNLERDHARFILGNIETYRRKNLDRGYELISALHGDFPTNTLIHFELIELLYMLERYEEAHAAALTLERSPRTGRLDEGRKTVARIWRARAETAMGEPARALETLAPFLAEEPEAPRWAKAWVRLSEGQALDALGQRTEALARYASVRSLEKPFVNKRAARRALAAIETPYRVRHAGISAPAQVSR